MTTLTRAQVREIDRRAIEEYGVPGVVLMENAGRGAAEELMRLNPEQKPVCIYCGKGNNGGDGFVIARHLDIHGWPVAVMLCAEPTGLTGAAAINYRVVSTSAIPIVHVIRRTAAGDVFAGLANLEAWRTEIKGMQDFPNEPGWIVDALFGTGLTGSIHGGFGNLIEGINRVRVIGANVLAIDIPSGLDCDTGKSLGPCVKADHTVTFVAPKAGFANPEAKEWLGEVHVVSIGAPRALLEQYGV